MRTVGSCFFHYSVLFQNRIGNSAVKILTRRIYILSKIPSVWKNDQIQLLWSNSNTEYRILLRISGPKIRKKDTGNRGAKGAELERHRRENRGAVGAEGGGAWGGGVPLPTGGGVWGGDSAPSPENFLILYIKMATFSALWALFCTVQLHVFQVKSSALGLKNCWCVHAESKWRQCMPGEKL